MNTDLCVVYESQGPLGAEVARSKLESAGVQCMLSYESVGRTLGLTVDGMGRVKVMVACVDEAHAREILAEIEDDLDDVDDE
jgi:hypothetical protein